MTEYFHLPPVIGENSKTPPQPYDPQSPPWRRPLYRVPYRLPFWSLIKSVAGYAPSLKSNRQRTVSFDLAPAAVSDSRTMPITDANVPRAPRLDFIIPPHTIGRTSADLYLDFSGPTSDAPCARTPRVPLSL